MMRTKTFDCVEMKRVLQEQRAKEYAGLTDEQIAERIQETLDTSDDSVAVWYRKVLAAASK
jgi:hypothetical protein